MVICGLSLFNPHSANAGESGELVIDHRPSPEMRQAWDRFQRAHPDANDDTESGISMLLDYAKTFQCCSDTHDGGRVISQILWDMRNGIGSGIEEFGQYYTDKLLVEATTRLSASNIETMGDLHDIMHFIADFGYIGTCPIGTNDDCADNITAAFERHGVCTDYPCTYTPRTCSGTPGCTDIPCLNYDSTNPLHCSTVFRPSGGRCSRTLERSPACCRDICTNELVIDHCQLFISEEVCLASCIGQEWSYDYRDCLNSFQYPIPDPFDCSVCDQYAP